MAAIKASTTVSPLHSEAVDQMMVVVFDGGTYTLPAPSDWDIEILEATEGGNIVAAMKLLLGIEQWAAFRSGHKKLRDIQAFFEAANSAGNS